MDLDSTVLAEADLPVFTFLLTQPTSFSLSSLFTVPLASLPLFFAKTALGCQPPAPPGQWWDSQGLCHDGLSTCGAWRWSWLPLSYEPAKRPKDGHHWSPEEDSDELTQAFGVLHSKRDSHARWRWGLAQGREWKGRISWNSGIAKDDQLSGILCSSAQLLETGAWKLYQSNRTKINILLRDGFTKKSCCCFEFCPKYPCPNILSPFHKCIFGQ